MMKKILGVLICLALLPFGALAEEMDLQLEGFVTEIVEGGFLMEDTELGEVMVNTSETTVWDGLLLEGELAACQYVLVDYNGMLTRSLPPQAHADRVGCYLLSGVMVNEFTESSTSALLNAGTGTWDAQVLEKAGIPLHLFPEAPVKSGAVLGGLTAEVQAVVGYNCQVILPASHDTGSAYMAVPARDEHAVYLSSGTWSLLGVEMDHPNTGEDARMIGFTNEGAYDGRVRFLRNIMGLWMLQCIRHENDDRYSFAEMADMALAADYAYTVDVGDNRFLAPASMTEEVKKALQEQGAPEPDLPQLLHCVNKSLALCYAQAIADLETLSGKKFTSINIVGGGSQSKVLNQWTADATRLPVYAGPSEGTALGNVAAQLIALGKMQDLQEARARIREDFDIQVYEASTN